MFVPAQIAKIEQTNRAMVEVIEHFAPWRVADFIVKPLGYKTNIFGEKSIIEEHQRPNYELAVQFYGQSMTRIDGRKLEIADDNTGGLIYLPMQLHEHLIQPDTAIFSLFFNCEPVNKNGVRQLGHLNNLIKKQKYRVRLPGDFMTDYDFISRHAVKKTELGFDIVRSRLREMLCKLLELNFDPGSFHLEADEIAVDHTANLVAEIKQIIEHFINRPIPKGEFETRFHLGMHRLNELFKSVEHKTIGQYLTHARLERALHLLTNSDSEITDIAIFTGFGSLQQFSMAFKRKYGKSPRELRQHRPAADNFTIDTNI